VTDLSPYSSPWRRHDWPLWGCRPPLLPAISKQAPGSLIGGNLSVDAVSEFSILNPNYSTENGRTSGGLSARSRVLALTSFMAAPANSFETALSTPGFFGSGHHSALPPPSIWGSWQRSSRPRCRRDHLDGSDFKTGAGRVEGYLVSLRGLHSKIDTHSESVPGPTLGKRGRQIPTEFACRREAKASYRSVAFVSG
jgi:hypothetical protein